MWSKRGRVGSAEKIKGQHRLEKWREKIEPSRSVQRFICTASGSSASRALKSHNLNAFLKTFFFKDSALLDFVTKRSLYHLKRLILSLIYYSQQKLQRLKFLFGFWDEYLCSCGLAVLQPPHQIWNDDCLNSRAREGKKRGERGRNYLKYIQQDIRK